MNGFTISSIQQIGTGTIDFRKSWNWYLKYFGFDVKILEDDTVAERMLPYTGGKAQKRHACIAVNLQGGGGLEIWQYSRRRPLPASFKVSIGDTGIFAAKLKCRSADRFRRSLSSDGIKCTPLSKDPSGRACFYVEDPFGNTFQVIERNDFFINDNKMCGGVAGALVGVSDIERSIQFYREVLGYDLKKYDIAGRFGDWAMARGGSEMYRRVLLHRSEKPSGPFSGLLGENEIELVQPLERNHPIIYEGRFWGDPGFIQICYDVTGMNELGQFCKSKGYPFTVDSCPDGEEFAMGEATGRFTYIEDPDGTLIEFVETYSIPLINRLGLKIKIDGKLKNRPLPKFIFRILGIVSRQSPK